MTWQWTEDQSDPCSLCVQWRAPDGTDDITMENEERAEPYWPDGSIVPEVYRGIHDRCMDVLWQMEQDRVQ